jgi:hypothetical protein
MITIHDFTHLPEGTCVPMEGTVVRCPSCGRTGIRGSDFRAARCVHVETSDVFCDGMLVEPTDSCPLPSPARN